MADQSTGRKRRPKGEGSLYLDKRGRWIGQASVGINPDTGKRKRVKVTGGPDESKASVEIRLKDKIAEVSPSVSAAERLRRRERAERLLAKQEERERRNKAARKAGGSLAKAYSNLRLHIEATDRAISESDDRENQALLREARQLAYQTEDKIVEVLRV